MARRQAPHGKPAANDRPYLDAKTAACFAMISKYAAANPSLLARMGGAVKRFGQRQIHGFTGAYGSRAAEIGLNPEHVSQGITSLPGLAKGMVTQPKKTLAAVRKNALSGPWSLAAGVGLPVALSAPDIARGDESASGGRSLRRKLVGLGGGVASGALTAGVPIIPQMVGSGAMESVADHLLGGPRRS